MRYPVIQKTKTQDTKCNKKDQKSKTTIKTTT